MVTRKVNKWFCNNDDGMILDDIFSVDEVTKAVKRLNKGKAAVCDSVTAEHLQYAAQNLPLILPDIFKRINELEYIPTNFRM